MAAFLLFLATVGSAAGQQDLFDVTTTGDGGTAYFATTLARKGTGEPTDYSNPSLTRIYKFGSEGLQLFLERPKVAVPPLTAPGGPPRFSNYFSLSRPTVSRDGTIVAITGQRICLGYSQDHFSNCDRENTLQTTLTGLPGGTSYVIGAGRLSGNGRYLLIYSDGSVTGSPAYVIDLQTGEEFRSGISLQFGLLGQGRIIADDGTVVAVIDKYLDIIRGTRGTPMEIGPYAAEAVIDSAARIVAYSQFDSYPSRSIRIYRIAEQSVISIRPMPDGNCHTPHISADGRRVMFLCDASRLSQIYTANTDGTEIRQMSRNASGVFSAAMSDDGKFAWYFSGLAELHRLNLDTGEDEERFGPTPQFGFNGRAVAGSAYFLSGSGFAGQVFTAQYPLPHSLGGVSVTVNGEDSPLLSVSPTQILFQVPWKTEPDAKVEVKTESSSPFDPRPFIFHSTRTAHGTFLTNPQSQPPVNGDDRNTLAIHQNFDALVTLENPAHPGEILHLYGTGFGQVDLPQPDGIPAPADPPARTVVPVTCWSWSTDNKTKLDIPVLYAGLAPGLVGIYQLDVALPATDLKPLMPLTCNGEGDSSNFYGSFAVKP